LNFTEQKYYDKHIDNDYSFYAPWMTGMKGTHNVKLTNFCLSAYFISKTAQYISLKFGVWWEGSPMLKVVS
jgi:hypothetical protein